jgi:hypothetical protein
MSRDGPKGEQRALAATAGDTQAEDEGALTLIPDWDRAEPESAGFPGPVHLGAFCATEPMAAGGMGEVWRGRWR